MGYSTNIVYLSKEQYQELITNETLTVNGQTITYNDNDIYVTPQAEPITDVKLAGTSIGSNGVANIPIAGSNLGIAKYTADFGVATNINNGYVFSVKAEDQTIKSGRDQYKSVVPYNQHGSVFYGLSKVAGIDLASETVTLGIYPDSSKAAIQNMLGVTDLLGNKNEGLIAAKAYAINDIFTANGKLYKATAAIAQDANIIPTTNCTETTITESFVKFTDYANTNKAGVIKVNNQGNFGVILISGELRLYPATDPKIKAGTTQYQSVTPMKQHSAVYYGLSKLAGVDLAEEEVTVGTYPETSKTAIRSLIGAAAVDDMPQNVTDLTNNAHFTSASFVGTGLVLSTASTWAEGVSF